MLKVNKKFEDCVTHATTPSYDRKGGGVFVLKECTEQDLRYLHDVCGMKVVIYEEGKTEKKPPII